MLWPWTTTLQKKIPRTLRHAGFERVGKNYFPNNFNAASAIFGAVRPCFT